MTGAPKIYELQIDIGPYGEPHLININIDSVAKALKDDEEGEKFALLFQDIFNSFRNTRKWGLQVGRELHGAHRTLQRSTIEFLLYAVAGLGEQEYTDARNEVAVAAAKEVLRMLEDGELATGYMI